MEFLNPTLEYEGELSARVIRKDGSSEDLGVISKSQKPLILRCKKSMSEWWRIFCQWFGHLERMAPKALVTTVGVNYMATDFIQGQASPSISAFNFQDCGEGATPANIGDFKLETPAGVARVAGVQTNPAVNKYRTVATISFTGPLAITEWGLFASATGGTLWDRRVFLPINVDDGDAIQFTYTLTVNAGGT